MKAANVFWNSMILQQITYMGVLESIKVKQINYPYRRAYKDFYERYEQLCSISATKRFDILVKEGADFEALTWRLLEETLQG